MNDRRARVSVTAEYIGRADNLPECQTRVDTGLRAA